MTSPMRLAALPSCDMVLTVRCDSATARAGHFGRFGRLGGDLADRDRELLDRTRHRRDIDRSGGRPSSRGAGFRRDRIGGVVEPARGVFQPARRFAQAVERLLDGGAEFPDQGRDRFAAPLARNVGFALHPGEALALDHIVAKYHDRARHLADLVVGMRRGRPRGGVAIGKPLHHRRQFLERLGDRAADAPAASRARSAPPPGQSR